MIMLAPLFGRQKVTWLITEKDGSVYFGKSKPEPSAKTKEMHAESIESEIIRF